MLILKYDSDSFNKAGRQTKKKCHYVILIVNPLMAFIQEVPVPRKGVWSRVVGTGRKGEQIMTTVSHNCQTWAFHNKELG